MNKKKMIMSTMLVLTGAFGGLVGCNNQPETNPTTQNEKKKVTLDKKANSEEKADEIAKADNSSSESKSETPATETSNTNTSSNNSTPSNNKANTSSTSSNSNKNNSSSSSTSNSSAQHAHNWVTQTKTVHHDEVGHYEQVKVGTIYHAATGIVHDICNVCGLDLTANNIEPADHGEEHALKGEGAGHHSEVVGHNNDAYTEDQYETKYVINQQAYDETVTTGYKCSTCGKTK